MSQRLADRDDEIERLVIENSELRERLFVKFGFTPSGKLETQRGGVAFQPFRTGRRRVHDMLNPAEQTAVLTEEETRQLDEAITQ